MKFILSVLLVLILFINQSLAAFTFGKCANSPAFSDFNIRSYTGVWYEVARFPAWFQPNSMKNVTATYTYLNDSMVAVRNSGINNGQFIDTKGYAYIRNSQLALNQLYVVFPTQLFGYTLYEQRGEYNIWSVDYTRFSLVYSCTQIINNLFKSEFVWILSRTPTLDKVTLELLKGLLLTSGVDVSNFIYA